MKNLRKGAEVNPSATSTGDSNAVLLGMFLGSTVAMTRIQAEKEVKIEEVHASGQALAAGHKQEPAACLCSTLPSKEPGPLAKEFATCRNWTSTEALLTLRRGT